MGSCSRAHHSSHLPSAATKMMLTRNNISNTQGGSPPTHTHVIAVLLNRYGNDVVLEHGNYRCHGCGSPDYLIAGSLNRGNRLSFWCVKCLVIGNTTGSFHMKHNLHAPTAILQDVIETIWSCNDLSSRIRREAIWLVNGENYANSMIQNATNGCASGCMGCLTINDMIAVWAPEIPTFKIWYCNNGTGGHDGYDDDRTVSLPPPTPSPSLPPPMPTRNWKQTTLSHWINHHD